MEVVEEVATILISVVIGTNKIVVDGYIRMVMHVLNARYLVKSFLQSFCEREKMVSYRQPVCTGLS